MVGVGLMAAIQSVVHSTIIKSNATLPQYKPFYDKYIRNTKITIAPNGDATISPGK